MFELTYGKSFDEYFETTQRCLRCIEGIEEFYELQKAIYDNDFLSWGDDQIDELAYNPTKNTLTVRICSSGRDVTYKDRKVSRIFWMIDFYEIELSYFDIAPEHWIDEVRIEQNKDGKYSCSFGTGELDFRYAYAKVKRSWVEY